MRSSQTLMPKKPVTILGIDPGLASTGYGIIEQRGQRLTLVTYGVVSTKPTQALPIRLKEIHQAIRRVLKVHKPDMIAIEQLFFAKNAKTAFAVGQARGVIFLALAGSTAQTVEYTPLQVKQAVVGYGQADKRQVQKMVRLLLGLRQLPRPDDAADALAIAICCSSHHRLHHP